MNEHLYSFTLVNEERECMCVCVGGESSSQMRTNRKIDPDVGCLSTKAMPICKLQTCLLLVPNPLVLHNRTFYMIETVYLIYQFTVYVSVRCVCFPVLKHITNNFNVFSASSVCEYVIYSMAGQ